MTNVNKTVAERLREVSCEQDCSIWTKLSGKKCSAFSICDKHRADAINTLADMIEAEQAELRERVDEGNNTFIDLAALDLLCDKLDCGDVKHRSIAEQIRKAMNGAEQTKTEHDGVDVDALLKLADYLEERTSYDPQGDRCIADNIRDAVKGAKPQLPEGVIWPRFEDDELVKFGDEFETPLSTVKVLDIKFSRNVMLFCDNDGRPYSHPYGEPVKRPEPEVLDADGVPIKVGDTVWTTYLGTKIKVAKIHRDNVYSIESEDADEFSGWYKANELTHRKPDTQEAINTEAVRIANLVETDCFTEVLDGINALLERQRKLLGGE